MATKLNSTAPAAPSTIHVIAVILTPAWIIIATVVYGLFSGEVTI